jgi:hypothetical protein
MFYVPGIEESSREPCERATQGNQRSRQGFRAISRKPSALHETGLRGRRQSRSLGALSAPFELLASLGKSPLGGRLPTLPRHEEVAPGCRQHVELHQRQTEPAWVDDIVKNDFAALRQMLDQGEAAPSLILVIPAAGRIN